MNTYSYILYAVILVSLWFIIEDGIFEKFGSSTGGALIQLQAKGPQDTYLTDDAWKYLYYPYPGAYPFGGYRYGRRYWSNRYGPLYPYQYYNYGYGLWYR